MNSHGEYVARASHHYPPHLTMNMTQVDAEAAASFESTPIVL